MTEAVDNQSIPQRSPLPVCLECSWNACEHANSQQASKRSPDTVSRAFSGCHAMLLQIVGKVKGAAAAPISTAAAAAAAPLLAAAGDGQGCGAASQRRSLDSSAAAAAMLAAPRHGLHTARARVSEQQVELAVVGPGDIIGTCTAQGTALLHPGSVPSRTPAGLRGLCQVRCTCWQLSANLAGWLSKGVPLPVAHWT